MVENGPDEKSPTDPARGPGDGVQAAGHGVSGRLLAGLGVALVVQMVFVFSYVGALHSPKPRNVSIGVVGASALPVAVGKQFSLKSTSYPSEAAAMHAIDERTIDGAFVLTPAGAKLIVVPAAGPAVASALGMAFSAAAVAFHQRLAVVQVHPLPKADGGGIVPFLLAMALVVGGYLSATMAMVFGGPATQRGRAAALTLVAVVGALLTDTIAGPILGAVPTSKFVTLWGLFILVMAAVAFATAALQTALGPPGTLVVVIVFVILGAPAAGGALPSALLPGFWATFGPYLPAGAATTAVRNTLYFAGNGMTRALLVLVAYLVVGALVVISIRRRGQVSGADVEAETAAAAVVIA